MNAIATTKLCDLASKISIYFANEQNEVTKNEWLTIIANIIRSEDIASKISKFNIYKYVTKEDLRPSLRGVFHENGFKIASDGHILIALKEDYDPYLEGKIMNKDGSFCDEIYKFPNWKLIIPNPDVMKSIKIDFDKFAEIESKHKAAKAMKMDRQTEVMFIKCPDLEIAVNIPLFRNFIDFMKYIGTDELLYLKSSEGVVAKKDENIGLIMPLSGRTNGSPYKFDDGFEEKYIL